MKQKSLLLNTCKQVNEVKNKIILNPWSEIYFIILVFWGYCKVVRFLTHRLHLHATLISARRVGHINVVGTLNRKNKANRERRTSNPAVADDCRKM